MLLNFPTVNSLVQSVKRVLQGRKMEDPVTLGDLVSFQTSLLRLVDSRMRLWSSLPEGKTMTPKEFAHWSGLTDAKVRMMCRNHDLKGAQYKDGAGWMIPTSELLRILQEAEDNLLPPDLRNPIFPD
ncbi:MAG: helix-turn-helix domain-containing protein [Bacteroidia bacterium]|nr:helix-turn-helix domain-containing protein [Bacteroidia bacterium]